MKRVFRHRSLADVGLVRGLLDRAGIACTTRNEQLAGALGDIPFLECEPELWILHDQDYARAMQIVGEHEAPASEHATWYCAACAEVNEGQFAACWRCGDADKGV